MSFVQVDSSVRTNRKFLRAGPAASWLWLCGNAYCQETLTDGFIPFEALRYLGVESPKPLIPKLVKAGLWDVTEGGWRVHDYLEHNKSAYEIKNLKRRRGDGGKLGGRPQKEPSSETLKVSDKVNLLENPSTPTPTATSTTSASDASTPAAIDTGAAFARFQNAYPEPRRKGGYLVQQLFVSAYERRGDQLFATLENHKASEQWQTPKLIPGMDKWFTDEMWRQTLPPPKAVGVTPKTAGTLEALQRFASKGSAQ